MHKIHRVVLGIARIMALLGGAVLTFLIVITCVSIIGREANSILHGMASAGILPGLSQGLIDAGLGALRGDYELVEAGMAFTIFAFLPLCTVTAGHASVDVFTNFLPRGANRLLEVLIAVLFAVVLVVIATQLYEGTLRKMSSGQTSLLLEFPIWWAYAASLAGACLAALTGVHVAVVRFYELLTGREIVPLVAGADH